MTLQAVGRKGTQPNGEEAAEGSGDEFEIKEAEDRRRWHDRANWNQEQSPERVLEKEGKEI